MQGVPGIIPSLALTKTLALICDIRKGCLSDAPAHLKLLSKLLQTGCLGNQVSCTCSCPWHRRRLRNTGQHMQCVLPGVGPYLVSPQSFSWSAVTFFKELSIKQKNKQTEELLKPVIFTAQFATLLLHLKVTGIPVCVCMLYCHWFQVEWKCH